MRDSNKFNNINKLDFDLQDLDFSLPNTSFDLKKTFFDWYGASLPIDDLQVLIDSANRHFVGDFKEATPNRPYNQAFQMVCGENVIFKVSYGGENPNPYIVSTSSNAPRVAEFLKKEFPDHSVSRFDSALDFDEEGAWETLVELGLYLAEKYKLKVNYQGDWRVGGKGGRTLYVGSRSSVVYLRIYEKGKEQIQKGIDVEASKDWVRVELEIKPQKKINKLLASRLDAVDAFSCSKWAIEMAELLGERGMPRIKLGTVHDTESALNKRLAFMLYQYGNTLEDIVEHRLGGCRDDLGDYLKSKMEWARETVQKSKQV